MATQQRVPRWVWPIAVVLLLAPVAVVAVWPDAHLLMIDLQVYRAGGEAVLRGTPLYEGGVLLDLPFVYPPFAALVFVPLAALPLPLVKTLWTAAGVGLVVFVVRRSAALLEWEPGRAVLALLVATVLALDPVHTTLNLGQVNVVLLALVLADLTGPPRPWTGVGVGLAAAVKLTPLLFVAYLLLTGRWRAAATAAGTFLAALALGFAIDPVDSAVYWLHGTFAAADRISPVAGGSNHALTGLLARAGAPGWVGLLAAGALAVAGLAVAVRVHRRGHVLLGLTLCGLLAAAAAPFAWSHHYVWFAPLVVLLAHPVGPGGAPRAEPGGRARPAARGSPEVRAAAPAASLAGLLVVTVAWVTALPGPGVGPLPATGLVSLQPDVYVVAVVVIVIAAAGCQQGGPAPVPWQQGHPAATPRGRRSDGGRANRTRRRGRRAGTNPGAGPVGEYR